MQFIKIFLLLIIINVHQRQGKVDGSGSIIETSLICEILSIVSEHSWRHEHKSLKNCLVYICIRVWRQVWVSRHRNKRVWKECELSYDWCYEETSFGLNREWKCRDLYHVFKEEKQTKQSRREEKIRKLISWISILHKIFPN